MKTDEEDDPKIKWVKQIYLNKLNNTFIAISNYLNDKNICSITFIYNI